MTFWAEAKLAESCYPLMSASDLFKKLQTEGLPKFLSVPFLGDALRQFDCWVAGGSIIDYLDGKRIDSIESDERNDIDLFCTKESLPKVAEFFNTQGTKEEGVENWKITPIMETDKATLYDVAGTYQVHLVKITWPSPLDNINDFDIRAAACAITKDEVIVLDGALEDIMNKEIKIRRERVTSPGRTFHRMLKYTHKKGFKASQEEYLKVIEETIVAELEEGKTLNQIVDKWEEYELNVAMLHNNTAMNPVLRGVLSQIQESVLLTEKLMEKSF